MATDDDDDDDGGDDDDDDGDDIVVVVVVAVVVVVGRGDRQGGDAHRRNQARLAELGREAGRLISKELKWEVGFRRKHKEATIKDPRVLQKRRAASDLADSVAEMVLQPLLEDAGFVALASEFRPGQLSICVVVDDAASFLSRRRECGLAAHFARRFGLGAGDLAVVACEADP